MPTIHDLPLEILEHMIKTAHSVDPCALDRKERERFLLATSLVCCAWRPFAQEALWECVYVSFMNMHRFVASGAGRCPIDELGLLLGGYAHLASIKAIMTTVRGVRKLLLVKGRERIDVRWLCGSNMRGRQHTLDRSRRF